MRSNSFQLVAAVVLGAGLTGCVSTETKTFPIGERRAPKPPGTVIEVFRQEPPTRAFAPVARVNFHIEKTFFIPSAFEEALPKLQDAARSHGADALVNFQEKKSRLNETFIYNVSALAIVFVE